MLKGVLTWWLNLQINELYFLSSKKRYTIKSNQAPLNQTSKMTFSFHKLCNHRRIKSIWKQQARQNTFSPKTPLRQKTEFNLHSLKEMKWCWLSTSCTLTWSWAKFFNICSGYSSDLGTWENLFYPINNSMISVTNYTSFAAVGFRWFPCWLQERALTCTNIHGIWMGIRKVGSGVNRFMNRVTLHRPLLTFRQTKNWSKQNNSHYRTHSFIN